VAATFLVMLTTAVSTLGPTYILGAAYGTVANGEGIDGVIAVNFALRLFVIAGCANHCQIQVFAWAMRDTTFVPGVAERILRPLLAAVGFFVWICSLWYFVDVQHPENDIALIKGVPGVVVGIVGVLLVQDTNVGLVELWRLYRARKLKLPPANSSGWNLTTAAGRGTLVAALALCVIHVIFQCFEHIFLPISAAFDKAGTIETYIGEGNSPLDGWWYVYYLCCTILLYCRNVNFKAGNV
jgi:hypothetical protein